EQRTRHVTGRCHEAWPVCAELEAHRHAADDADGECQREDLYPEVVSVLPVAIAGEREACTKVNEGPAQPDRDRREQDVETDVGRELYAGEQQRIEFSHVASFWNVLDQSGTGEYRAPLYRSGRKDDMRMQVLVDKPG